MSEADDQKRWEDAALAGPCFCRGDFICTKHLILKEREDEAALARLKKEGSL